MIPGKMRKHYIVELESGEAVTYIMTFFVRDITHIYIILSGMTKKEYNGREHESIDFIRRSTCSSLYQIEKLLNKKTLSYFKDDVWKQHPYMFRIIHPEEQYYIHGYNEKHSLSYMVEHHDEYLHRYNDFRDRLNYVINCIPLFF